MDIITNFIPPLPNLPNIPNLPNLPTLPLPNLPNLPNLQNLPDFSSLSQIPLSPNLDLSQNDIYLTTTTLITWLKSKFPLPTVTDPTNPLPTLPPELILHIIDICLETWPYPSDFTGLAQTCRMLKLYLMSRREVFNKRRRQILSSNLRSYLSSTQQDTTLAAFILKTYHLSARFKIHTKYLSRPVGSECPYCKSCHRPAISLEVSIDAYNEDELSESWFPNFGGAKNIGGDITPEDSELSNDLKVLASEVGLGCVVYWPNDVCVIKIVSDAL